LLCFLPVSAYGFGGHWRRLPGAARGAFDARGAQPCGQLARILVKNISHDWVKLSRNLQPTFK
jgi:hypothetical protein